MSQERDADRQLRAWVSEGADRAPERFVWAAIDEIERTTQRARWRTNLEGLLLRVRPPVAMAAAAAVLIVVALAGQLLGPEIGPSAGRRSFATADLAGIVVWETTMPPTWTLDNLVSNATDVRRVPIRSMSAAELNALQDPPGLLAGRYTNFSGTDAVFMSWALLFDRDVDAAAAFPGYVDELEASDAWGLGPGEAIGLGDEGLLFEGETTALTGPPTGVDPVPAAVYLWRDGNLLLAIGGWFDFDPVELRAVAEGVDQRAADASGGER